MAKARIGSDLYVDGEIELEDDLIVKGQVVSLVDLIAPFVVTSTVLNENLNADLLDGEHGAYYLDLANATGVLGVAHGGTGLSTVGSAGQLLRSTGTGLEYFTHDFISSTLLGAVNGVATLDATGKVPLVQLPTMGMQYKGTWNASTNTPTLSDGTGNEGEFYRVVVGGTVNLGSGNIEFKVGDDVIHNGISWELAPAGSVTPDLQAVTDQGATTTNNITVSKSGGGAIQVMNPDNGYYILNAVSPTISAIAGYHTAHSFGIGSNSSLGAAFLLFQNNTTSDEWTLEYSSGLSASLGAGNQLRVQQDPVHNNDLARKLYVDTGLSTKFDVPTGSTSQYIRGDGSLATFPSIPTIGDGVLTLAVGTGLTGSATFTANQSGNSTFTVGLGTNLSNLNALSTSGFVKKTGANTWSIDTTTYMAASNAYTKTESDAKYALLSNSVSAGNGLTGGGAISSNPSITLGTPGNITLASTNSVSTSSHTHAFVPGGSTSQYIRGDGTLATFPTIGDGTLTLAAGTGLTGSASFTANQSGNSTFTVGLGTNLSNLNALSTSGFVKKTGASTWTIDTNTYLTSADLSGYLTEANADNRYMSTSNAYGGSSSSYTGVDLDGIVRTSTTYHSSAINHPTGFNYGHVTTFVYGGHRAQLFLASDAADAFYYRQKHHANSTYSSWRQVASRSWTENYVTSILPTVNDGTLTLAVGTGLTGSASFTANQSGNSTFTVGLGTNLSNFNALSSTGFVKKTGANTWTIDTNTYLTANQTITLTGDITGSGTTSIPTTISNNVVTYAKLQQAASPGIIGRSTAGSGNYGHITIGTGLSLSGGVLSATSTGGANLTPGVGLSGDVYNGSTARTWTVDLPYLRQQFVSTTLNDPGNLDTTSTVGANDIEGTSVIHTTATGNRPVASQGIISTFLRNGTTGYQTYFAPVVSGDSYYYRGISAGFSSWYQHASREWVSANYALLSAIPTNYVTTDTNQSSLGGHKAWTGSHRWTLSSNVTPSVAASSIAIGKATSGIYLIAYDNDANQAFAFRTYAASNYQLTLDKGGIETSNHGNSSQWNAAYSWGNHASAGYVPGTRTLQFTAGSGLSVSGTASTNLSVDRTVTYSLTFGTTAGTVAQGNDSRINNGQTAYGWGNHASAGYVHTSRQVNTSGSLQGGGNLGSNRTLSLVNDNGAPGNNKYYGTNNAGVKGFYDLPSTGSFVPNSRTITINGITQDLSTNRSWTIPTGVTGSGSNGYIARWNSGSGITNSELYQSGSNIGIGTTSPVDKLTINGTLGVTGDAAVRGTALHVHNNLAIGKYDSVPGNRAHGSLLVHSGDTSTYAHVSAALEIRSTTKALLLPRQSTTQWDNIGSKPEGLFSYDTTDKSIRWFTGTETIKLFANNLGFWVFVGGIYRRINFDL